MNRATNERSVDPEWIDDDELEIVGVGFENTRPLGAQISVRFDSESARLLRRAAAIEGVTQAEFVRRASLSIARETVARTT